MQLQFYINNQYIKRVDTNKVVADSVNYLEAYFMFSDADWSGVNKTAIFSDGANCYEMLILHNKCAVPAEVIKYPEFTVSVFGGNLITTNKATVNVIGSGYTEPAAATENVYNQILDLATNAETTANAAIKIANSVQEAAENGEYNGATFTPSVSDDGVLSWTNDKNLENPEEVNIKGPQGEQGEQGKPGLTPYIGTNNHWWIGNKDTGYSAVPDNSQVEEVTKRLEEIQAELQAQLDLTITEERLTEAISSAIQEHNTSESAHAELFEQINTWKAITEGD